MYRIFSLVFLACGAWGQISLEGQCDYATTDYVQQINLTELHGTWHQISRIENHSEIGDCSTLTITEVNGTEQAVFSHSEIFNTTKITRNGTVEEIEGSNGWLLMTSENLTLNFVLLSTNNSNLAIMYSCYSFQDTSKQVWAWQYSRNSTLSSDEEATLDRIISSQPDLLNATWRATNQSATVCGQDDGNAGVTLAVPHVLTIIFTLMFLGREFI